MKIVALIPARGGSKGIPSKNIVSLAEKPLLFYSIDAAKNANIIDEIYVSSDDDKILAVAQSYQANCIFRDPLIAQDSTPTDPVIVDFIEKTDLDNEDIIVLLQPTSPLRTAQHIHEAVILFKNHQDCGSLMSMYEADNKYLYAYVNNGDYLRPAFEYYSMIPRRQDLPNIYLPNGAIYIFTVANFRLLNKIPRSNLLPYIMDKDSSIDIDTLDDLKIAEKYLHRRVEHV